MTKLRRYQNRYRGLTTRASWWDYGGDGIYHVEINLKDKARWFGEIENGVVKLSEAGKIAQQEWLRIPIKYPYVSLDEFVIMPDHMHGIVVVKMESGKNPTGSSAGFEKPENPINLESPDSPDSRTAAIDGIRAQRKLKTEKKAAQRERRTQCYTIIWDGVSDGTKHCVPFKFEKHFQYSNGIRNFGITLFYQKRNSKL